MNENIQQLKDAIKGLTYSEMLKVADELDCHHFQEVDNDEHCVGFADIGTKHMAEALRRFAENEND